MVVSIVALNGVMVVPVASGLSKIYTSIISRRDDVAGAFYCSSFLIVVGVSLALAAVSYFYYLELSVVVVSFFLGACSINKLNLRYVEEDKKYKLLAGTRVLAGISVFSIKLVAALFSSKIIFLFSFVFEAIIYMVLLRVPSRYYLDFEIGRNGLKDSIALAMKLLPTEFAASFSLRYPILLFSSLGLPELAALYNAASRIPDAVTGLAMALFSAVRPAAYRECSVGGLGRFPFESTKNYFAIIIGIVIMLAIFLPWITPMIFGQAYDEVRYVSSIYALITIPIVLGSIQEVWLICNGYYRMSVYRVLLGGGASIVFVTLLFFEYRIIGAVIGVVLSAFVQAVFSNLVFKELRPIFYEQFRLVRSIFRIKYFDLSDKSSQK
ncbi:lipopolysaccharide biosynthesis protein [Granulosicoccus sp. 3-233]